MVTYEISLLQDYDLIISPESINLIKELNNYCWLEKKSSTPVDKHNHLMNSMGAIFARTLQKHTRTRVLQVHNTQNKITRIIMQSATISNHFVFVKRDTNDYHQFMSNVLSFSKEGKQKNDDAPDCLAGLSMFIKSLFRNLEI